MGDRGNVKVKQQDGNNIWIYSHWGGSDMPVKLQDAMIYAKGRWNDESYLTRCLITEICKSARDNTGYGVSTYPTDNEHDVLEVDCEAQTIRVLDCAGFHDEKKNWEKDSRKVKAEWSFTDYCALPLGDDGWSILHQAALDAPPPEA